MKLDIWSTTLGSWYFPPHSTGYFTYFHISSHSTGYFTYFHVSSHSIGYFTFTFHPITLVISLSHFLQFHSLFHLLSHFIQFLWLIHLLSHFIPFCWLFHIHCHISQKSEMMQFLGCSRNEFVPLTWTDVGHVDFLEKAAAQGDFLIVGLHTDPVSGRSIVIS